MNVTQHSGCVGEALCSETVATTNKTLAKPVAVSVKGWGAHVCFVVYGVGCETEAHDAAVQAAPQQHGVCLARIVDEGVDVALDDKRLCLDGG